MPKKPEDSPEDTIASRISRALAERIIHGELVPGSRLAQDHIAEEFGASHVPVREAFRRLEAQGLVVSIPRRGVRVASFDLKQVREVAEHLQGRPLQAVLVSPYVRAQQTADLLCEALGFTGQRQTVTWLTPESDVQQVIGEIERLGLEHVLLVSHQPLVGTLVGALEHGHLQQPAAMSTASLAELEGDWPLAGLMTLRALNSPA